MPVLITDFKRGFKDERYEPIPLTPEILETCGFVFESGIDYVIKETGFAVYFDDGNCELANHDYPVHIKHLHQLQNLFFALTGTELNYTP